MYSNFKHKKHTLHLPQKLTLSSSTSLLKWLKSICCSPACNQMQVFIR